MPKIINLKKHIINLRIYALLFIRKYFLMDLYMRRLTVYTTVVGGGGGGLYIETIFDVNN